MKLKKKRSRLELRSKFFSNRVINAWNNLAEDIVVAETTNAFKNRFDSTHWATKYNAST